MFEFVKNIFYKPAQNDKEDFSLQNPIKLMYQINRPEPTDFFLAIRTIAGQCLQKEINKLKGKRWFEGAHWLKPELTYPCFEHLTFAYKNQIFCILIDVLDEKTGTSYLPINSKNNLIEMCLKNNLIPCLFKMTVQNPEKPIFNSIKPIKDGWNLFNAIDDTEIIPENVATDEQIEMSEWELHNFAIQIVREYITNSLGHKVLSFQSIPEIDPQVWFEDEIGKKKYVVVRNTIFPQFRAKIPENINSIEMSCAGHQGYFTSIAFKADNSEPSKIYRGNGVNIEFSGLEEL